MKDNNTIGIYHDNEKGKSVPVTPPQTIVRGSPPPPLHFQISTLVLSRGPATRDQIQGNRKVSSLAWVLKGEIVTQRYREPTLGREASRGNLGRCPSTSSANTNLGSTAVTLWVQGAPPLEGISDSRFINKVGLIGKSTLYYNIYMYLCTAT